MYVPPTDVDDDDDADEPPRSLLDAVDLHKVLKDSKAKAPLGIHEVPGGSVSFLFERTSETATDDVEAVEEDEGLEK